MSTTKTILVVGASGQQGGSVAKYLLEDGTFKVRCLLRNIESDAAKKFFNDGAELVKGNLNSVESLVKAMQGCYGVFGVTNFWDPSIGFDGEIKHGKNMADACQQAGVQCFVFSTLDGNSNVPHFESKFQVEQYAKTRVPTISLVTSFYFENFTTFFPPKLEGDELVFSVPQQAETMVPMYSVADTGGWVVEAFKHPELYINKDIDARGQYISYPELVETFSRVTGQKARFNQLDLDTFRGFGFPGAEELALNFKFFDDLHTKVKVDRRRTAGRTSFKGKTWQEYLETTECPVVKN